MFIGKILKHCVLAVVVCCRRDDRCVSERLPVKVVIEKADDTHVASFGCLDRCAAQQQRATGDVLDLLQHNGWIFGGPQHRGDAAATRGFLDSCGSSLDVGESDIAREMGNECELS